MLYKHSDYGKIKSRQFHPQICHTPKPLAKGPHLTGKICRIAFERKLRHN
jgi:hypothetical protein